jgi:transposase
LSQQANDTALLLEMMRQFREDYARDQEAASQTRAAMRDRIDELFDRFARMETTAALSAEVDAQVRTELDALTKALTDVEPVAVEWNRVKSIGKWAASGLLASGVGIGALAAAAGDQVVAFIRAWLRIP